MPRRYDPETYYYGRDADDPRERGESRSKSPAWQKWIKWIGIGLGVTFVLLFILSATGNLGGTGPDTGLNQTEEPSKYEQLTQYIQAQEAQGLRRDEIETRLELAGFTPQEIELAYQLNDPIVQQIYELRAEGRTQQEIVEILLNQGLTPEEIQSRFDLIEQAEGGVGIFGPDSWLRNNWLLVLAILAIIYFVWKNQSEEDKTKLLPKVYTLDECEEYARTYLDKKGKHYNPSRQYRNRPDIRQYRFVYEEPLYPEFNDHQWNGHKAGKRLLWLIAVGYDREVIDYHETTNDALIDRFLYGAPKGFEQSGSREYMGLRSKSEMPIEEAKQRQEPTMEEGPYAPYRPANRRPQIRPGPVRGYEGR